MDKKDIVNELIDEYRRDSDVCMGEFLAYKKVPKGMTFEQAFEAYKDCMEQIEGDIYFPKNISILTVERRLNGGEREFSAVAYKTKRLAQKSLVEDLNLDFQYGNFENVSNQDELESYEIHRLARMFAEDENFEFDVNDVTLWSGTLDDDCKHYIKYQIKEVEIY